MGWKKAKTKSFPTPRPCPSPRAGALAQSRRSIASSQLSCRRPRRIWDDVANLATKAKAEQTMKTKNYTTSFTVDQSPEEVFEISKKDGKTALRFTHVGLVPAIECYGDCSGAWGFLINESLRSLITAGKGQPNQNKKGSGK